MISEMKSHYEKEMKSAARTAIFRYICGPNAESFSSRWGITDDDELVEMARIAFPENHSDVVAGICILRASKTFGDTLIAIGELIKLSADFEFIWEYAESIYSYNKKR